MSKWNIRGRGNDLEELITLSNFFYHKHKICRIDKIPTPIKVLEVTNRGKINEAYFEKKSTVDFCGIAQGNFIAFDAKQCNESSLPLKNIHIHQIEYMQDIENQGGLTFLIVEFTKINRFFILPFEILIDFYKNAQKGGRKSIPLKVFPKELEVEYIKGVRLKYLESLNKYIDWKKEYEI